MIIKRSFIKAALGRWRAKPVVPPTAPTNLSKQLEPQVWHGCFERADEYSWMQQSVFKSNLQQYLKDEREYAIEMSKGTRKLQRKLRQEMLVASEVDQLPPPIETRCDDFIYYTRQSPCGSPVYCRRCVVMNGTGEKTNEQVLMDTSKLGCELKNLLVSEDHRLMGCLVAKQNLATETHSEDGTLLIYSLESSTDTPKHIETLDNVFNFVFGGNSDTIYYTVLNEKLRSHKLVGHRIGTNQDFGDIDIYEEADQECFVDITRTKDKQFHVINSSALGSSEIRIFPSQHDFWQTDTGNRPSVLCLMRKRQKGVEYFVDHHNNEFVILANSPPISTTAPGSIGSHSQDPLPFRLLRAPTARPTSEHWNVLFSVSENENIDDVEVFRDHIMAVIKNKQGHPAVVVYNRLTDTHQELAIPHEGNCTVRPEDNPQFDISTVRLGFTSPVHLKTIVEYDMNTMKSLRTWLSDPLHVDPNEYIVQRVKIASHDGVDVYMTLVYHESVLLSHSGPPTAPALIRVYGAYGVPLEPEYRVEDIPLLRRGWVIALAHVRGGGELGRQWYANGKGLHKHNSISDFIACSRALLDKGWTNTSKLAATGTSAGGLVVGAALNKCPNLFRAATLHVPFVDPLSAMLDANIPLTTVENTEWGNPLTSKQDYVNIRQYAPYENIPNEQISTSILVTAGARDQRVSVWQPAKWVARLRGRQKHDSKLLFYPYMSSGHFHHHSHSEEDDFMSAFAMRNAFLITEVTDDK